MSSIHPTDLSKKDVAAGISNHVNIDVTSKNILLQSLTLDLDETRTFTQLKSDRIKEGFYPMLSDLVHSAVKVGIWRNVLEKLSSNLESVSCTFYTAAVR